MTQIPTHDELRDVLRHIKGIGGMNALARVTTTGIRTLYRHAEDEGYPRMDGKTSRELAALFSEAGLVGEYGFATLNRAVEIWEKAPSRSGAGAEKAAGSSRGRAAKRGERRKG